MGFSKDYPDGLDSGMHSHPRAQLMYAVSGVMRVETPKTSYIVPPTTALLLPADAPHAIRMDGHVAMRELFLHQDAANRIGERSMVIVVSPLLRELILAVCEQPLDWDLHGRGHHLSELILDEAARAKELPFSLPMPSDTRLRRVAAALRAHPNDRRGLEAWADIANASSRTLARLFRAETGMSFRQWRQQARMTAAMTALSMGANPAKAAALAGFDSQPAFGASFRQQFGLTPGQAVREVGRPHSIASFGATGLPEGAKQARQ